MKLDVKNKPTKSNFLKATPIKVVTETPETLEGAKAEKVEALANLTVTVNGKEFYADTESRVDLTQAIEIAIENGLVETAWKCKNGVFTVTLDELKQARTLALTTKGAIVGVV